MIIKININLFFYAFQTIEKLTQSINELNEKILLFIKTCHETEFPNTVESTEQIFSQHLIQKNDFNQELQRIKM